MRIDVRKFLFIGIEDVRQEFFKKAQNEGIIHFVDSRSGKTQEIPPHIQSLSQAIKVLRGLPPTEQLESEDYTHAEGVAIDILKLKDAIEKLHEERRVLRLEIARVEIFGNFSLDDMAYIKAYADRCIQFFFAKQGTALAMEEHPEVIYVGSEQGLDYFVAINKEPVSYDQLIEMKVEHPVGQLQHKMQEVKHDLHVKEQKIHEFSKYNQFLHRALIRSLNRYHLETTQEYGKPALDESLFAVEGWVPEDKISELEKLTANLPVQAEEIAPDENDVAPTYLENRGLARLGEDLVGIYDTPSNTDKDPSLWVILAFGLFFAFIVGDAGYGTIYLLFALYLRYKFPNLTGLKKRVLNLVTFLCCICIMWGVLTNSYFGIVMDAHNPLRKVSLIHWLAIKKAEYTISHHDASYQEWVKKFPFLANEKDPEKFLTEAVSKTEYGLNKYEILDKYSDTALFELALFIGAIHLILSLLRNLRKNPGGIGWILAIIGGYFYFPYYLKAPSFVNTIFHVEPEMAGQIGLQLIEIGIPLAVIVAIFKHGFTGIFEIMTVIQVFADILSYLRLYALALAGMIVGVTINGMAKAVPIVIGVILLLCAHFINMVLGIMSGVIHGLRLNFLEWYHYSFEGGGKKFKPLELIKHD